LIYVIAVLAMLRDGNTRDFVAVIRLSGRGGASNMT
jgi:hypothetical protein